MQEEAYSSCVSCSLASTQAMSLRALNSVIGPELDLFAFLYLDDIIVEHISKLQESFLRLRPANLRINSENGSSSRIYTDPDRVPATMEMKPPEYFKDLRHLHLYWRKTFAIERRPVSVSDRLFGPKVKRKIECQLIQSNLAEKNNKNVPDYAIGNNQLYPHISRHPHEENNSNWKLCVHSPIRTRVLQENHNQPGASNSDRNDGSLN